MCHVTDRQCGAFTVLVFHAVVFLVLIHSCSGQSEPIGPSQPIVAMVGDDTVLPCQLVPVMNAFVMTVEWARQDLDPRFVLLWRDGVELASKKHPSYRGRTSLSTNRLEDGDVSLKLSSVRISDEGRYRCFIPGLQKSPTVQLVVGAVSSPQVLMNEISNGNVLLRCDAKGWYPEPEVVWLDAEGDHVPAGPAETLRGPDGLYAVSSSLTVEKRRGNFTCRVQQKTTNQTRETHVQVADHSSMVSPHVLIGAIIGCAALLFIPAVLFVVWKRQQKKHKTKRRSPEDGAEQTEEEKEVTSNRDNTGVQDGEHVSLLAGREEENNEIERIQSETNRDQLVTKPDGDNPEEETEIKSISEEEVRLIPAEGETHQMQDMKNKGEGDQTMKLPLVLVEDGQKEQQLNVHAALEVRREEETNQAPMNNVDKEEAKKKNKKEREEKVDSGQTGKKKLLENRKERKQQELERRRQQTGMQHEDAKVEDQEGKQSNITRTKDGKQKEQLRETKKENEENKKTLQSKLKTPEIVAIKDQEGNQSEITRTTERNAENQKETLKETEEVKDDNVKESEEQENIQIDEEKIDLTETKRRSPEDGAEQTEEVKEVTSNRDDTGVQDGEHVSLLAGREEENNEIERIQSETNRDQLVTKPDGDNPEEETKIKSISEEKVRLIDEEKIDLQTKEEGTIKHEAEHKDEKGNQSNFNTMTESQKMQINEESKESEMERGERETPSVSREVTARPDQKVHQEITGRQNLEENKLKPEKSQRSQEETKEQLEKSMRGVKVERVKVEKEIREQPELSKPHAVKALQHQEPSQAEPMEIDSSPQTQRKVNHKQHEQEKELHAVKALQHQEASQAELMEIDSSPQTQRKVKQKQREQEKELHVNPQQTAMKRQRREDRGAKTRKTIKKLKERLGKRELKELLRERELKELLRERELKELLREQELKELLREQELLRERELKELLREQELKELLRERNGDPMEFKEGTKMDQEVRNEPQVYDWNSQQDQAPMGLEDNREKPMEL
ncbi:golgin subfamily A member 6-like protein 25 [Cebidichthys violaceus]|uniref:golgin subfamily A member 6-like protein 25 n=1 Tax=Cebidichthys violaceus TaxID=271503 RepID=UPI0035CBF953